SVCGAPPSPATATIGRSGQASPAAIAAGSAKPSVRQRPDNSTRWPRFSKQRPHQSVWSPVSSATTAFCGIASDRSFINRCGARRGFGTGGGAVPGGGVLAGSAVPEGGAESGGGAVPGGGAGCSPLGVPCGVLLAFSDDWLSDDW